MLLIIYIFKLRIYYLIIYNNNNIKTTKKVSWDQEIIININKNVARLLYKTFLKYNSRENEVLRNLF